MAEKTVIQCTPVGRLVSGSPFRGNDKDADGHPLVIKSGANAGQPRVKYDMGLAIPKSDAGVDALRKTIVDTARAAFPSLNLDDNGKPANGGKFSIKITDGDDATPNSKGNAPKDREGFPGHWVFWFSSSFAPDCFVADGKGGFASLTPNPAQPSPIKTGDYIRINGTVCGNASQQNPGVYLNQNMVELVGPGEEIQSAGPNAAAAFGTPAAAPVSAPTPPPSTTTSVTPAHDFVSGPPAADVDMRIDPANGTAFPRKHFTDAGWTDAQVDTLVKA